MLNILDLLLDLDYEAPVSEHGKVVNVEFESYRDVITYEDGYQEIFSIGE